MKKVLKGFLIAALAVLSLFILNIFLYAAVPDYRQILLRAVGSDSAAASVSRETEAEEQTEVLVKEEEKTVLSSDNDPEEIKEYDDAKISDNLLIEKDENTEKKPLIIDREYHEDCGTGKGYWVITYSDGTQSVEQDNF